MTAQQRFITFTFATLAGMLGFLIGYGLCDWWGWT